MYINLKSYKLLSLHHHSETVKTFQNHHSLEHIVLFGTKHTESPCCILEQGARNIYCLKVLIRSQDAISPLTGLTVSLRKLAHALNRDFLGFKYFQLKKFDIFSYFCSKHRLWLHVRTASRRRFRTASNEYPESMFWSKHKNK